MLNSLSINTKKYSEFTVNVLLKELDAESLEPKMYLSDGTPVLIEGKQLSIIEDDENVNSFEIRYRFEASASFFRSFKRNELLPETAMILKKKTRNRYIYIGIANITQDKTIRGVAKAGYLDCNVWASGIINGEALSKLKVSKKYGAVDPKTREQLVKTYYRSPEVADYARRVAKGKCQLCGSPAPFKDRARRPYLEVHHVKWLSRGGTDTTDNVVALCPNCHSRMHVLDDLEDIRKLEGVIAKRK